VRLALALVLLVALAVAIAIAIRAPRILPRLDYYASEIGRYQLWVSSVEGRAQWVEATALRGRALDLVDGQSLPLDDVRAYAVMYPSGMMVDMEPRVTRPLPPGATFPKGIRPPDQHILELSELEEGRQRVTVSFTRSGAHPRDPSYYTTTLTNTSQESVRVLRFGGYARTGSRYELNTITGGFFTAAYFRDWYAVPDPDGRIPPGGSVSDPNNYGGPKDSLWAYEFETESGERFWTGGTPSVF